MSQVVSQCSTADLCDLYCQSANPALQQAHPGLIPFGAQRSCGGPAATVSCVDDNVLIRELVGSPGLGRILVIDGAASVNRALLGDIQAAKAMENGWAGLVINGYVRDRDSLAHLPFAVFALGTVPLRPLKTGAGAVGKPVSFLNVTIAEGDWVYVDADGLLVSKHSLQQPTEALTED